MLRDPADIQKEKEEKKRIAKEPANRKLKYLALTSGILGIILLIIIILGLEVLSLTAFLVLRGCAGICAIVFFILVACYLYRINHTYHKQKYGS